MPLNTAAALKRGSIGLFAMMLVACSDTDTTTASDTTAPNDVAAAVDQSQPESIAESITTAELLEKADQDSPTPGVSPTRRINRGDGGNRRNGDDNRNQNDDLVVSAEFRTIDGTGNNTEQSEMGAAHTHLARWLRPDYADGVSAMAGSNRPSPRAISNAVFAQAGSLPNPAGASDFLWQWGQFLDHDIDLTDGMNPPEPVDIAVPAGDPFFDPTGSGTAQISFNRSLYDTATGTASSNPRQQINEITSWIDGSMVYGSDDERAVALRINDGTGRLLTSAGELLPFNESGLPNAGGDSAELFIAGDVRANEQLGLTVMHTLFVREHNWHANRIRDEQPGLSGDQIYQLARQIVSAEIQAITYNEYLPALLGRGALDPYRGYQVNVDGAIANIFSGAAFRYGHSALSRTLRRLDAQGNTITAGDLPLRNAFFAPQRLVDEGGIEPVLRGLASQVCQTIDAQVIDDVRNFLFGPPGSGGFDLVSLNIQRGRDHGLPSYNDVRAGLGLNRAATFEDVSSDPDVQDRLVSAYDNVDAIDVWVGGLAEDPMPNAQVGELVFTVLKRQFEALRDADRYWYESALSNDLVERVNSTRLSDIIRRNTAIENEIPDNVFRVN